MMVKRKLHGAVDKSSADWEIRKSDAIVHNLWKICRPVPSGTRSYGRLAGWQAGRRNLGEASDFQCLLQIEIFNFSLCLAKVLHHFNNFDALQTLFKDKYCYKVVLWSVNFYEALWFHIDPYYTTLPCCMIPMLYCSDLITGQWHWCPELYMVATSGCILRLNTFQLFFYTKAFYIHHFNIWLVLLYLALLIPNIFNVHVSIPYSSTLFSQNLETT